MKIEPSPATLEEIRDRLLSVRHKGRTDLWEGEALDLADVITEYLAAHPQEPTK